MSQLAITHRLKRMRTMFPPSLNRIGEASKSTHSSGVELVYPGKVHKMLQILLGNPWDDYHYLYDSGPDVVATRKVSYFEVVTIRQCDSSDVVKQYRLLSGVQNANIANVYELYCDGDRSFQVTEHFQISLSQLEMQNYELDEWEMATILAEVLRGITYLSSLKLSCKHLSIADIGLNLDGEIKLVLDLRKLEHDYSHECSKTPQVLLDFPILIELVEDMMLSRYHLISGDEKLSDDALSFLSCTWSGSLETLMKHDFLEIAVSPRRLIPRIRFAFEKLPRKSIKE